MPGPGCIRALSIIFCPCITIFYSIKILLCGFFFVCLRGCGLCIKAACCSCWEAICCACCGCSGYYVDKKFPPTRSSLGQVEGAVRAKWMRLEDLCGGDDKAVLVNGGISPCEIGQGGLGDCWLLSAMASLAEFPSLVREVFVVKQRNDYQKYTFRLYNEKTKVFQNVTVDTWVPCINKRPMFTRPVGNAMWVPLIEKAVAKMHGSYGALDGGSMERGIRVLSGATIVRIVKPTAGDIWGRSNSAKTYKNPQIFDLVRNFDYHKSIMTCSITLNVRRSELRGLQTGHAYTLVGVFKIGEFRLFKLRNPWGSGEWTGAWGDGSSMWSKYPDVRRAVKHVDVNDGVFFMEDYDFTRLFDYMAFGVRESGFNDIAYEPYETETCGACKGLCVGCCKFWCCCQGLRAACCYTTEEPDMGAYHGQCCC